MTKDFCEKTLDCIEALTKKIDKLEEASFLTSKLIQQLNEKINLLSKGEINENTYN